MINNTLPIFRQNCKEFANNTDGVTITSLEIAKLTGKSHIHIMRDIREILGKIRDVSKFGYIYKDSYGREQNCFALPKTEALILVSGYSVELRETDIYKIIICPIKNMWIVAILQLSRGLMQLKRALKTTHKR